MKSLVYHGPRDMRWEDWQDPEPGAGEVLVAVRAVGICGSDLRGYTGESGHRMPPLVMGHEAAGEVVAPGPGLAQRMMGARVVVRPDLVCGTCDACRAGMTNRCRDRRLIGVQVPGAMSERVVVPAENVLPLPDDVSFTHATLAEPLAVAIHATRRAGSLTDASVLIAGCGPIGLLTLVAARRAGARIVVTTDVVPQRLSTARALGADAALDPREDAWREQLAEVCGSDGVDVAFDAVGIQATFGQALQTVQPGGVVIAIGGWRTVDLNLSPFVRHEVELRGTFNYTPAEFKEALRWLVEGALDPDLLVTDVHPLPDGAAVFEALAVRRGAGIKVVMTA